MEKDVTAREVEGSGFYKNKMEAVLKSIQASILIRSIDNEITRRTRTTEGNTMEVLLLEVKGEELRQILRIVDNHIRDL